MVLANTSGTQAKIAASEKALVAEKRHMLNVEKSALRDLVQGAATGKHATSAATSLQFLAAEQGQLYVTV